MNNYKTKYLKYKAKYLKLKGGDSDNSELSKGEKKISEKNPLFSIFMTNSLNPPPPTPESPNTPLSPNTPDNSPEPIAPNIILPSTPEEPQIPTTPTNIESSEEPQIPNTPTNIESSEISTVSKSYTTEIAGAMVGVSLISCLLINILKT